MSGALTPLEYWRGSVDERLDDHRDELDELRTDVDELQRARWKFSGVIAVVTVAGAVAGGSLSMIAGYLVLHFLHVN